MPRVELRYPQIVAFAGFSFACLAPACVIGRSARPSATESAQGPLAPPVTGAPIVPTTLAENSDAPADKAKPGAVWVQGYWHWTGVSYVWQRGRWQRSAAP
ncbi:MAG: YXWGXW repeat-containing protein [Polyangiaceae bacterium]